jgi:hypothetical protein
MNVSNSVFYRNLCALSAVQIEFLRTTVDWRFIGKSGSSSLRLADHVPGAVRLVCLRSRIAWYSL